MSQWSITDVANLTHLSPHTLRYYERIGLMSGINRGGSGRRVYVETDIGWIRFLQMLRATGMPLEQIARFVELEKIGVETLEARRALLQQQRLGLQAHIAELNLTLEALDQKIAYYENANPQNCDCLGRAEPNGV